MLRVLFFALFVVGTLASAGCAGTWDTLTSRRFREHPLVAMQNMVSPEDPVMVLRADPPRDGDERAAAMHRLKEPLRNGGSLDDQEAILEILSWSARVDPSPVLRMEAIGALGRFEDPRAAEILIAAFQTAHGRKESDAAVAPSPRALDPGVVQTGASGGRSPIRGPIERFPITGPTGFPPEWVASIRCRALHSLGQTNRPEATKFLTAVAGAAGKDIAIEGSEDREVKIAAIRALGRCRQPESVVALAQVLATESEKQDTAIIGRAHEGLVRLTGQKLPPDPRKWDEVVQAGVTLAPEPTWVDEAIEQAIRIVK